MNNKSKSFFDDFFIYLLVGILPLLLSLLFILNEIYFTICNENLFLLKYLLWNMGFIPSFLIVSYFVSRAYNYCKYHQRMILFLFLLLSVEIVDIFIYEINSILYIESRSILTCFLFVATYYVLKNLFSQIFDYVKRTKIIIKLARRASKFLRKRNR